MVRTALTQADIAQYLSLLSPDNSHLSLTSHLLSQPESQLLSLLLLLISPSLSKALTLAPLLHTDDVPLFQLLADRLLFNSQLLRDEISEGTMPIPYPPITLNTAMGESSPEVANIMREISQHLPLVKDTYMRFLLQNKRTETQTPGKIKSLNLGNRGETLLPVDWMFQPFICVQNSREAGPPLALSDAAVTWCLAYTLLQPPSPSPSLWVQLATLFLLPDTPYLLPRVHSLLYSHLSRLVDVDLTHPVPGLTSTLDFYKELVESFLSESYGSPLFALLLLLGSLPHQPAALRQYLWLEKPEALAAITLSPHSLPHPLSVDSFFPCPTSSLPLVAAHFRALQGAGLSAEKNSLLWQIAVNSVNSLLTYQEQLPSEVDNFKTYVRKEISDTKELRDIFEVS